MKEGEATENVQQNLPVRIPTIGFPHVFICRRAPSEAPAIPQTLIRLAAQSNGDTLRWLWGMGGYFPAAPFLHSSSRRPI